MRHINFKFLFLFVCLVNSPLGALAQGNKAVLLIDMQYGFYDRGGVRDSAGLQTLVSNQTKLLKAAVKNNLPVIVLQYRNFGETDSRLMDVVENHEHEIIWKSYDSGFVEDELKRRLNQLGVETLLVAGVNGCCCVHGTVVDALNEGFSIETSPELVGNLNHNPPTFPNSTWYPEHSNFRVYNQLEDLLTNHFAEPLVAVVEGAGAEE
jgi:nicotinamidase-related amidase